MPPSELVREKAYAESCSACERLAPSRMSEAATRLASNGLAFGGLIFILLVFAVSAAAPGSRPMTRTPPTRCCALAASAHRGTSLASTLKDATC